MSTQKVKDKLQVEVVGKLRAADGHGIIEGATGVGKTKIAIDFLISVKAVITILWVVPTSALRDIVIPAEWDKWGHRTFFEDRVKIICYKSLHKETDFYNYIVWDEGHNITLRAYGGVTTRYRKYDGIILLTATTPEEDLKRRILKHAGLQVVHQISVDGALDKGLVAPYQVHLYPVPMGKTNNFLIKGKDGKNSYSTSEHNRYYALQGHINRYKAGKAPMPLYLARMHSIYRFSSKIKAAEHILAGIDKSKRILIFCGSIQTAERINPYTYHSKTNTAYYEAFNNKEINRLAVVNSLNEGHNMVDVDIAIMIQVNSKKRNYIQRQGRAIRWRKGHKAQIYILYSQDTVDWRWVQSSLDGVDKKRVHIEKPIIL